MKQGAQVKDVWPCGRAMGQYQGTFPLGFLNRIQENLCDIRNGAKVLYPFGGTTPQRSNWTVNDINEDLDVDTHHDARDLPEEWEDSFDVVISDPPYDEHFADEYYDVEYPRPKEHFVEAARCVKPGGYLIILDWLVYQNYCPNQLERETVIGLTSGPKQRIRAVNVFRKIQTLEDFREKNGDNA